MLGLIVNLITLIISIIWFFKEKTFDSSIALLASISTLIGQSTDKILKKSKRIKQSIKSGNNAVNNNFNDITINK